MLIGIAKAIGGKNLIDNIQKAKLSPPVLNLDRLYALGIPKKRAKIVEIVVIIKLFVKASYPPSSHNSK